MTDLGGRVTIITGAGSGIGLAMTQAFLEAGARVFAVDLDAGRLADLAATAAAPEALATHVADVAAEGPILGMLAACDAAFGPVEVICNNAGILDR
ncbi:SDR family NAD(P)-dependent oxidoreductase, partial [Methylobrevis pamukkalensis]|uniref:SDR family NAD(P)-dependent oxidoreductase n=1 Tax=Methylobrevis pamukkalensis TaxID=1439726 RepID=UPI00114D38CE